MKFEDYEKTKFHEYQSFAKKVSSILRSALKAEGTAYQLWDIQSRAKNPGSLKSKLINRGLLENEYIENEIIDLAGCRLIFYSNDDVNKFLGSGIVNENFEIDWDKSKIHQPIEGTDNASELYRAHHFLVSLKDDRAKLPEYSQFAGQKCEIQIQTILNHAWSETGHDVIYKPPKLDGFGTRQHEEIKKRMARIMYKHLLPAGYEFQKVLHDFERLKMGKELFDRDVLQSIESASDNNELFEILERFKEHVVPNYDDIQGVCQDVLTIATRAIDLSRIVKSKPISTPFGDIHGRKEEDIFEIALDIIEYIRYVDVQSVFSILCEIYLNTDSDKEKEKIVNVIKSLAEHNIHVWKQAGPYIQSLLTKQLSNLTDEKLNRLRPIVIEVCRETLSPDVEGTSSTHETVTFHQGTVVASDELLRVRKSAIGLLQQIYVSSENESEKRAIIIALGNAFRLPMRGDYKDDLIEMVLEDSNSIIEFYLSMAEDEQFEILQSIEHDLLWNYRHTKQWKEGGKIGADAIKVAEKLVLTIKNYRDFINENEDYIRYKTLVGFESVFPQSWDDENFEIAEIDTYREQKIEEYVESINNDNADEWFSFIKRCSETDSNDLATFPTFGKFLRTLSEKKPEIALRYLDDISENLSFFLPAFLGGLWISANKSELEEHIKTWIEEHKYLSSISRHYRNAGLVEDPIFKSTLDAAIEIQDDNAVNEVLVACVEHHNKENSTDIIEIFFQTIDYLTDKQDTRWTWEVGFQANKSSLFDALDKYQVDRILTNLIYAPRITHREERVLASIAKKHSDSVIEYFGKRIEFEKEIRGEND